MGRRYDSFRRPRRRRAGGRELLLSFDRPPAIPLVREPPGFVALVPTRVYEDLPYVAFKGNGPDGPRLLPVPCLHCGVRTDWVLYRTDRKADPGRAVCEACQAGPAITQHLGLR